MTQSERYARQIQVNKIGTDGQRAIDKASAVIVGVGGLGCQVGAQLAGAGVGHLRLIDQDTVSLTNLHRQILFREGDIGDSKACVAARELRALNSQIAITDYSVRADQNNLNELIGEAQVVIDAADNFVTSYLLSDFCVAHRIPLISASVNRTFGYVGVFCGTENKPAPSFRALFPRIPTQQLSCDTAGVTGPSVGIIANLQAQEAIKVILDDNTQLRGKIMYLDLWSYQQHFVDFSAAVEPTENRVELVSESDVNPDDIVLDVREPQEVDDSPMTFKNMLCIPLSELIHGAGEFPDQNRVVCACLSGQRALIAAQQLLDRGRSNIAALIPSDKPR